MNLAAVSNRLKAKFPKHEIKWRIGATNGRKNRDGSWEKEPTLGLPLAYIDARAVMDRLDDVVGPDNWSNRFEETPTGRVICYLTIFGITKADGAGATDMEGEKGGLSDAFKRAAVHFGIGRYLYAPSDQVWVPVVVKGRGVFLKGAPPDLYGDETKPEEKVTPFPQAARKKEHEENTEDAVRQKAIQSISKLFKDGIDLIGMDDFLFRANALIENGYGVEDWKSLPINELRGLYRDVATMINNVKENRNAVE